MKWLVTQLQERGAAGGEAMNGLGGKRSESDQRWAAFLTARFARERPRSRRVLEAVISAAAGLIVPAVAFSVAVLIRAGLDQGDGPVLQNLSMVVRASVAVLASLTALFAAAVGYYQRRLEQRLTLREDVRGQEQVLFGLIEDDIAELFEEVG